MAIMPATENAQWRTLYDAVRGAAYGTSYTYAELNVLAGVTDVTHQRWILIRTREELVRHDRRFLDNVRGVGYRIVDAEEHLRVGNAYRERSMRQAGKSVKVLESTDLSQIPDPTTPDSDHQPAHQDGPDRAGGPASVGTAGHHGADHGPAGDRVPGSERSTQSGRGGSFGR